MICTYIYVYSRFVLNQAETSIINPVSSTQEVIDGVGSSPGAIGYTDLGSANQANASVTSIDIDGSAPTPGLVENNHYQFWAVERMYTKGAASGLTKSFITYVINNIQTGETFIRIADMPASTIKTHE
jgi:phosphate transport system substrate-binding protein